MTTLAHLSDLHFGTTVPALLEALRNDLERQRPDVLVISGDFTQRAKKSEFLAARDYLAQLPTPQLIVPGNHDLPHWNVLSRFARPLARYRRYLTNDLCPFLETADCAILGLNTARPAGPYLDWSRGRISNWQIRRAAAAFRAVEPGKVKIVVTHHPFLVPESARSRGLIGNARAALRQFAEIGVDLLLSGHLHLGYTGHALTRHQIIERILVIQAATATSNRLKNEANAYNWITFDGPNITLRKRVWNGAAFVEAPENRFEIAHLADPTRPDDVQQTH